MKYNRIGKSELYASEIGFGCMSLKGTEKENDALIYRAMEAGVNFFDTADLYDKGENEIKIGKAIKDKRNEIILATKVGNQWREDGSGWDWNPQKKYILEAAEKSLRRLQTDYIDLYQLHGGTINDPIDETIEAFEILKRQGKIRYYGMSSIRPNVIREYIKRSGIVSVMMQYSLLDRRPEEECLPLLQQNEIAVLARGSVAQGLLIDKPSKEYLDRPATEVEKAAKMIAGLSGNSRNAAHTAIRFVLQAPGITMAVVGIKTMEQLEEAIKATESDPLTDKEIQLLKTAITPNYYKEHR